MKEDLMQKLETAIWECSDPDYALHYKPLAEQAEYILGIAREIIESENEEEKRKQEENHIEDLINGVQV